MDKFNQLKKRLKELNINHQFIKHKPIRTVEEGLAFLGIEASKGVSTLLLNGDGKYYIVFRRDDHQLDFEKIKKILKVKNLRFANKEEVKKILGCQIGNVCFYNPGFFPLMDETILEREFVYGGTGSPEYDLKIRPKDLVRLSGAKVVDIISKMKMRVKKRILSGITPSGDGMLHIGNYLGAVRQFLKFQKTYDCFFFVADFHALSTVQSKKELQRNVENLVLNYLALGIDPEKSTFYRQSDIRVHTELQSILNNVTPLALVKRGHAYKDKLQKGEKKEDINMGLFCYPILMAADILMYKADLVPVGKDQKQHIEITRDIAQRFNALFGQVFKLPQAYIPQEVAVIVGTCGRRKMSKSLGNYIGIFEPEEEIKKQVMDCFTDPTRIHPTDPGHIKGNPVFVYHRLLNEDKKEVKDLEGRYKKGKVGDVEVKERLFKALMKKFGPARKRYQELKSNPGLVKEILKQGALKARKIAFETMNEVREAIGIKNRYSSFEYDDRHI